VPLAICRLWSSSESYLGPLRKPMFTSQSISMQSHPGGLITTSSPGPGSGLGNHRSGSHHEHGHRHEQSQRPAQTLLDRARITTAATNETSFLDMTLLLQKLSVLLCPWTV
jgi:hypothetical protein